MFFKVTSKGGLVDRGRFRLRRGNGNVNLRITYAMAPSAKLLVFYTRSNGEIIADAITFTVDDIFKTKVLSITYLMCTDVNGPACAQQNTFKYIRIFSNSNKSV